MTAYPAVISKYPLTSVYFRQLALIVGTDWRCIWSAWCESDLELTGRPGVDRRTCQLMRFPACAGTVNN